MKKLTLLVLALVLCVGLLSACGQKTAEPAATDAPAAEAPAAEEAAEAPAAEEAAEAPAEEAPKRRGRPRKKIDEMTPGEAIALHAQRNTYAVQVADKETKRELYAPEDIFVEEGDEQFLETQADKRHEEWYEIVASAQENHEIDVMRGTKILKGTLSSITRVESKLEEDDPEYIPEYMARIKFMSGLFNVEIPSYVFYHYSYPNMNRAMANDIQRNLLNRLGSEVSFVVRYADEKTGKVIGDRLGALSLRGVRNYTSQNGRRPSVMPGDKVLAKIIAVSQHHITVDAAGAEIRIPLEEISWLYVSDARIFDGINTEQCYQVGGHVNVKILSANLEKVKVMNNNYTLVKATGSIKQAYANPKIKYFPEYRVGDFYSGKVTGIAEKGIYVNINGHMDILCGFPKDRANPMLEETVKVRVNKKDEEQLRIWGSLIR